MTTFDFKLLRRLPTALLGRLEPGPVHPRLGTPCVLWTHPRLARNGYGRVYHRGKERVAHRVVYEWVTGRLVDEHLLLDHRCKVRHCVAPWHVEPVTPAINTRRGDAQLFKRRGEYA